MANVQGQGAYQIQTQQQTLTPLQVLTVRLTELPLNDLRERIEKELEDNPWLQGESGDSTEPSEKTSGTVEDREYTVEGTGTEDDADYAAPSEYADSYDDVDDGIPREPRNYDENTRQREVGDTSESFFDHLVGQLGEFDLNDHELEVMKYLIGSLADDGLLRTPLYQIADELDVYQNIQTSEEELERLLTTVLQQMDPAGVGGRDLRECLTLQVRRNYQGQVRDQLITLFQRYWDDFAHLRWQRIQRVLKLDDLELDHLRQRIQRLNPRPGGSLGGDHSDNHAITPDFTVETDENGQIHMTLNEGELPRLTISPDAEQELQVPAMTKNERDALNYLKQQVGNGRMFIEAIAQRRETMLKTMQAIIRLQRPFFLEGDETLLRPMRLEDVANLTGQDISTVSRVSNSKYVQTDHGIYALRWFFTSGTLQNGDEVTVRKTLSALREIVEAEDKSHPLSDERLVALLRERGFAVARRTVAKYRTQLGIADSRMRKE